MDSTLQAGMTIGVRDESSFSSSNVRNLQCQNLPLEDMKEFVKYGFRRIKATVSNSGTITFGNRKYYVAAGAENFSQHKSTKVYISCFADKLFIFKYKDDGLPLGEVICQKPFEKPVYLPEDKIESNEVELIAKFLEQQGMVIERVSLIEKKNNLIDTCHSQKDLQAQQKKIQKLSAI